MLIIDDIIVSDDLYMVRFNCMLSKCYGACCVEGDSGAPLEEEEISMLEDHLEDIIPYMTDRGKEIITKYGVFDYDASGNFVTPLVRDSECVYCHFDGDGIARCIIEEAFTNGKINFNKPISCHLYPVRLSTYDDFEAVNYHKWHVCKSALKHGKKEGTMLYNFLKVPLIRKYGEEWYDKLDQAVKERLEEIDDA